VLSFISFICVFWAVAAIFKAQRDVAELVGAERYSKKTPRNQMIAIIQWRDMLFSGGIAALILVDFTGRLFSSRPIFVILGWILAALSVVFRLSMRQYVKSLTFKNKEYWKGKPLPRRMLR